MCAVIQRGILGGFKNKIGNVVGSSWKGIATMRSLPLSVANPRTVGQVTQRTKFSLATKLGSAILAGTVKPLWDRFAQKESGFNAFVKSNVELMVGDAVDYVTSLVMSKGVLMPSNLLTGVLDTSANTLAVSWVQAPGGDASPFDLPYLTVVGYEIGGGDIIITKTFPAFSQRGGGSQTLFGVDLVGNAEQFNAFLSFKNADGNKVSNSTQLQLTIVA